MKRCLLWFRRDLRLKDNAALAAAIASGAGILPVYIHGLDQPLGLGEGSASRWWLHHALEDLNEQLSKIGSRLLFFQSKDIATDLCHLVQDLEIEAVFWNRRYQPAAIQLDKRIKKELIREGVEVKTYNSSVLNEPHSIQNQSGRPYRVFTPYWKCCKAKEVSEVVDLDLNKARWIESKSCNLEELDLLPKMNWDMQFYEEWTPTRKGAEDRLKGFFNKTVYSYNRDRDMMAEDGTSIMSPYLHFGQIGVREIYGRLKNCGDSVMDGYIRQLYWRDFAHHLIYHFPHSVKSSLKPEYDQFPWRHSEVFLKQWQEGQTGYPVIDAAMRQLWKTGWMHNRARMVVGSFLVKHLLQDWKSGADWFWDTLVDADLPNNIMGWQWVAGSGADAAPYFRVFNPLLQAGKFDPEGDYVRKYVPELADIPGKAIHDPWALSATKLASYGVQLGRDYPERMINLQEGRDGALAAYQEFKERTRI